MLRNKSLTELRGMAQSFGIADLFSMDAAQLAQAIELRQQDLVPPKPEPIDRPVYDARLMDKPPARKSDREMLEEYLAPYVARGVVLTFDEENWYMRLGIKSDQGTLRMRPATAIRCAERLLKPSNG